MKTSTFVWLLFLGFFSQLFVGVGTSFAAQGFRIAGVNVGYMSKDELCPVHVSVEEISIFLGRLNAVCLEFYKNDTKPKQFDVVVVVHRGHVHYWFVGHQGDQLEFEPLRAALNRVDPPTLKKEPIAFSFDARVADGRRPERKGSVDGMPVIPEEWNSAAAKDKDKSGLQLHLDGLIDLLCPPPLAPAASGVS